jgi:hypothetical protein
MSGLAAKRSIVDLLHYEKYQYIRPEHHRSVISIYFRTADNVMPLLSSQREKFSPSEPLMQDQRPSLRIKSQGRGEAA